MNKPSSTRETPTPPAKGSSGIVWFFLCVFGVLVLIQIFDPPVKRDVFNPAIRKEVNTQIEAADVRSGYTLTDKQVEDIAEKTSLKEVRKSRYEQPNSR